MTKFCAGVPAKLLPRIASVSPSPATGRPSEVMTGGGSVVGSVTETGTLAVKPCDCTTTDVVPSATAVMRPADDTVTTAASSDT